MAQVFANFFRVGWWPLLLAVALIGGIGPFLLRARGARALWVAAAAVWLVIAIASLVNLASIQGFLLPLLAGWLALIAGLILLLAKSKWPAAVRSLIALLVALALPLATIWGILNLTGGLEGRLP